MQLAQKWNAPLATGSGTEAFTELGGDGRLFPIHEMNQFSK